MSHGDDEQEEARMSVSDMRKRFEQLSSSSSKPAQASTAGASSSAAARSPRPASAPAPAASASEPQTSSIRSSKAPQVGENASQAQDNSTAPELSVTNAELEPASTPPPDVASSQQLMDVSIPTRVPEKKRAPPPPPSRQLSRQPVTPAPEASASASTGSSTDLRGSLDPPKASMSKPVRQSSMLSASGASLRSDTSSNGAASPFAGGTSVESLPAEEAAAFIEQRATPPAGPVLPPRPSPVPSRSNTIATPGPPPPIPPKPTPQSSEPQPALSSSPSNTIGDYMPPPPPRRIAIAAPSTTPPSRRSTFSTPAHSGVPFIPSKTSSVGSAESLLGLAAPPSRKAARSDPGNPPAPSAVGGSDDESDGPEEDDSFKPHETPDATFANRCPPAIRGRNGIRAHGAVYSAAIHADRVVTGQHHVYIWDMYDEVGPTVVDLPGGEQRIVALEFRAAPLDVPEDEGRWVWGGTSGGHVFELDIDECRITNIRYSMHTGPVVAILRVGRGMVTVDEMGKCMIWGADEGAEPPLLSSQPVAQRLSERPTHVGECGGLLWSCAAAAGRTASTPHGPRIRAYDPFGSTFNVSQRAASPPATSGYIDSVTTSAVVPTHPDRIYFGHENGFISIWSVRDQACLGVQRVSTYMITTLVGVHDTLWAGFRTGSIHVYDVSSTPWIVRKTWKPHKETVTKLMVNPASLSTRSRLEVASLGVDMTVQLWDGFLRQDWLDTRLQERQPDYCSFRSINTLIVTWNVDATKPADLRGPPENLNLLQDVMASVDSPDIIVFGFQELIDLENKTLTAKSMIMGKKRVDQKFSEGVSQSYRQWHDKLVQAVRLAMPPDCPYVVVHAGDLVGLFSCIFVKKSEREALRDVALVTVKTGMGGRYGNKGAIAARFVIDDSSVCFINCHLAAGQRQRRQRDQDLVDILEDKSGFSELETVAPGAYTCGGQGKSIFDHELVFLSGDLNYRIDERRDTVVKAVEDGRLEPLLAKDQLLRSMSTNPAHRLRSFKEAPITFAPTYKYDPGTTEYDTSGKKRIPAWCDRCVYRSDTPKKITPLHYQRYEAKVSDHRPVSAAFSMRIKRIDPVQRAIVAKELEQDWLDVEADLIAEAVAYYGAMP